MSFKPSEKMVGGFTNCDGTIDFYLRVNSLINSEAVVLDLGAGRAAWYYDDNCKVRKEIRNLRGKVKELIAADVDDAVLENKCSDKQLFITNGVIDINPYSVDVIIADYVLEHIDNPKEFYYQVNACLKSGGWFCARTPHKYSYVAILGSLINNSFHSKILRFVQPNRKEIDVFPTRYRLNKLNDIRTNFISWENMTFIYRSEPAYFFGNKFIFLMLSILHRFLPAFMCGNLFIFLRKSEFFNI